MNHSLLDISIEVQPLMIYVWCFEQDALTDVLFFPSFLFFWTLLRFRCARIFYVRNFATFNYRLAKHSMLISTYENWFTAPSAKSRDIKTDCKQCRVSQAIPKPKSKLNSMAIHGTIVIRIRIRCEAIATSYKAIYCVSSTSMCNVHSTIPV